MNFQIRSFAIKPDGVVWLPPGCVLRSITATKAGVVANIEVPVTGKFKPYTVAVLADGDSVPDFSTYLGTLPPLGSPWRPVWPAMLARRLSPRHYYLCEVRL